ncbi:hypothetical protein D3C87_2090510 [compost metagenome]
MYRPGLARKRSISVRRSGSSMPGRVRISTGRLPILPIRANPFSTSSLALGFKAGSVASSLKVSIKV